MLSILIVNWNTRDLLRACLLSLRDTCRDIEHEVIVVDNASSDNSSSMVRAEFPEVKLLANSDNRGYAAGNNQAFNEARGEWIWLLNPDTEVQPGAPLAMCQFLQMHPHCGAVASMLVDAHTGKPQRSCRSFPTPAALWVEALGLARRFPRSRRFGFYRMGWWKYDDARMVEQPMASSLMLRWQAIEEAGGLFDEQFPIFFNDVDLAWRLHVAGWPIWYLPEAKVLHHGGASTRQVRPAMIHESHRSLQLFYQKHWRKSTNPLTFATTLLMMRAAGALRVAVAQRRRSL
jgi:GT2 family glycosyltransferase